MPNVNVTYDEMRQAATRLRNGQAEIESKLSELQNLVTGLVNSGYVTDTSSRQFEQAYQTFTNGATNTIRGLQDMGTYLETAASTFAAADAELASRLNRA